MPVPSDRTITALKWILGLAVVLFLAWLLVLVAQVNDRADGLSVRLGTAQSERAALQGRVDAQDEAIAERNAAIGEANEKLKDVGKPPVTVPDQPASVPDEDGTPALTSEDVVSLISAEVSSQHPDLTKAQRERIVKAAAVKAAERIPKPEDGEDGPTLEEMRPIITAEVAQIPEPEDGKDGRTPSAEEVEAALEALCGGSCVGPKGEPGSAGPAGPAGPAGAPGAKGDQGRGITTITCTGGHLVVTYTDGAQEQINATCTTEPAPTPPSPSPSSTTSPQG